MGYAYCAISLLVKLGDKQVNCISALFKDGVRGCHVLAVGYPYQL